ncbi:MAG TPA: biopolymer transporter ExbD [Blastocatellia bacterium]|nr:biopolymer transporter ExbD [Blastocatellia bacterium]HMZ20599.1 biopolymer transporter ExbD [Blastocatellia bacterium]HNG34201.1 biopolymer transporter ExbD [Blastocatellia bacterium]
MSMSTGGGGGSVQADINVTPMVDIMLVLLIIFMVVTPLLQSGVTVILPRGKNPDEDANITKDSAVVVSIPSDGVYYLGRDPIRKELLVEKIKVRMKALKPSDPQVVYIKGGVNVSYGDVVDVVNMIRDAEIQQLGLVSDKKKVNEQ